MFRCRVKTSVFSETCDILDRINKWPINNGNHKDIRLSPTSTVSVTTASGVVISLNGSGEIEYVISLFFFFMP